MNAQAANQYLRAKVLTATPEQLQLMLYDGAIRFAEQAKLALQKKDFEQSYILINQTQKIVSELTCSLKHEVYPELCGKLASLYAFAYRKLTEASMERKVEMLDDALRVLRYQRETWAMLLEKLAQQKAGQAAMKLDLPAPSSKMEASISFQG